MTNRVIISLGTYPGLPAGGFDIANTGGGRGERNARPRALKSARTAGDGPEERLEPPETGLKNARTTGDGPEERPEPQGDGPEERLEPPGTGLKNAWSCRVRAEEKPVSHKTENFS